MGNTIVFESEDFMSSNILKDKLTYVSSKQHKYLGQIQLWKNKQNQNEWVFSKQIRFLRLRLIIILLILNIYKGNQCSMNIYQNIMVVQSKSRHFKEQQKNLEFIMNFNQPIYQWFLKIINSMVNMLKSRLFGKLITQISTVFAYLDRKNKFHSNINFDSLFFDKAHNVKILYHGALPNLLSSYAQTLGNYNSNISLSPQQMKDYQNHLTQLQINPFKQDSYSFGIILVSIMSGKDVTKYTDFYKEVIHYQQILNILGSAFHYYSQSLVNIVVSLLQYDDSKRPNISQIFKVKIYRQPTFQYQPQQQTVKQNQTINIYRMETTQPNNIYRMETTQPNNIYRMETTQSYSSQKHRIDNQNQYHLISPTKNTLSITNNTIVYSSPRKTQRTSYAYPKQFQLANGYFTPKAKQSSSISYRFLSSRTFSKVQSPYIK